MTPYFPGAINAGLARAKAHGRRLGRPRAGEEAEEVIGEALTEGDKRMRKVAGELGVSVLRGSNRNGRGTDACSTRPLIC